MLLLKNDLFILLWKVAHPAGVPMLSLNNKHTYKMILSDFQCLLTPTKIPILLYITSQLGTGC